ncbi:hypothetical protein V8F20_008949 [Naviculisporaceae sp. PSN 640]
MFECGTCGRGFPAGCRARDQHCDATGHSPPRYECDKCDAYFRSESARRQHMNAKGHWARTYECQICDDLFYGKDDCKNHEIEDHYYCSDCDRSFHSLNNIKMHLNSRIHRGTEVLCPFCRREYATATGMVHHLEAGSCPRAQGMSRDEIYRFVRSKDPNGILAKKLIGWHGEPTYEVTGRTWDGYCYRCYLCNRGFGSLGSLQAHINSNAHKQTLYHCPNRRCGQEFKALAAVINHLESESCGAMRFETVQRRITDIVSSDRRLTF